MRADTDATPKLLGIDHIVLRVRDLATMQRFYCEVLGCTLERRQEAIGLTQLRAGDALIDLVTVEGTLGRAGGAAPGREGRNLDHLCLRVAQLDEAALRAHLARHGVQAGDIAPRYGAQGEGPSIYLSDPEGNMVELKAPPDDEMARAFVHARRIAAPPEAVWAAFAQPARLARWWGPAGFRSTFSQFEFREGGDWRFLLHGPDGTDYPNHCRFVSLDPPRGLVIEHVGTLHHFLLHIGLAAQDDGTTLLRWRQVFDSVAHRERIAAVVPAANEQNLDRLAAEVLAGEPPATA